MKNFITTVFLKIKDFYISHKKLSIVISILFVLIIYWAYKSFSPSAPDQYVTSVVAKGTIVSSVTASGQVSASNQIDLKSKTSGTITYIGVKPGDVVKKGKTLFSVDDKDAEKAVRDAEVNLETAQLDLEKFQAVPKDVDVSAINNAIKDAENSKKDAQKSVDNAYTNLLNSTFEVVPDGIYTDYTAPTVTGNYVLGKEGVIKIYVYNTGNGSGFTINGLLNGNGVVSYNTPQPIGDSGLFIKFPNNTPINSWVINIPNKKATNYLSNYNAYQNSLDNQESTNRNADLTIAEQKQKLADLYQPDPLDLRAKQLAVTQRQNALSDAKDTLSDYYVSAPFDGTIASVTGKLGDTASGTLGTIITKQKIATVSLNEVDIAKIKLGQKATISFDAIEGLSMTGTVSEIDSIGTVSSGVVNYSVKINFDDQDERVKPGMSMSVSIITDVAQDVISVPNSAIKKQNGASYVEVFDSPLAPSTGSQGSPSAVLPRHVDVTTGLSNTTSTEILSGLKEGDIIVTKTVSGTTTAKSTTSAPSILNAVGGNTRGATGGAGGNFRNTGR